MDALSWFEEVFFYRLVVNCDDYGRMDARPAILRARLFPLKTVTDKQMEQALQSLRSAGIIDLYFVDGKPYLQMRTWEKHQQIRSKKSKYPSPDTRLQADDIKCNQVQSNVPVIQSEYESISEYEYKSESLLLPQQQNNAHTHTREPSHTEVFKYMAEKGVDTAFNEANVFIAYNAKRGWDCLPEWEKAADLWCARILERNCKGATQ